jgi:hypothetical protein
MSYYLWLIFWGVLFVAYEYLFGKEAREIRRFNKRVRKLGPKPDAIDPFY